MTDIGLNDRIPMIPPYKVISRVSILAEKQDYNHEMMNVPAMWKSTRGAGVKVVVLDTGIPKHVDIGHAGGKSFIENYSEDKNGHGTHVGGIIAATANNDMGVAGIAPECECWFGSVLDGNGSGSIASIVKGIRWAVDEVGAHVINMSLGISAGARRIKEMEDACDYAASQGVVVVCAAGNEYGAVGQPAIYDSVLAIAAVNNFKEHASFSNTGPEVDFASGGVNVYSTYLNNGYSKLSGTSMASPAMAGIVALIIADEFKDTGKLLTLDEVTTKLKKIAFDVGDEGFDEVYGHGIPVFVQHEEPTEPDEPVEEPDKPTEPIEPDEPVDEPDEPNKEPDDGISPCKLGVPMTKAFIAAAVKEMDSPAPAGDRDRALKGIESGIRGLGRFLKRLEK